MRGSSLLLLLIVLAVIGVWVALSYLSRESRMERRRRKSHSRIISKAQEPSVKFSVRWPKK